MPTTTSRNTASTGQASLLAGKRFLQGVRSALGAARAEARVVSTDSMYCTVAMSPGITAGHEQCADRLFRVHRVDHQDHRRRDQDAERAARGERAGVQRGRIAELAHFRPGDLGHGRRSGERRAADSAEGSAAADGRHGQAAAPVPEPGARARKQAPFPPWWRTRISGTRDDRKGVVEKLREGHLARLSSGVCVDRRISPRPQRSIATAQAAQRNERKRAKNSQMARSKRYFDAARLRLRKVVRRRPLSTQHAT